MKRGKLKIKKVVLFLIFIIFIAACVFIFMNFGNNKNSIFDSSKVGYLASTTSKVPVYEIKTIESDDEEKETKKISLKEEVKRGTKVKYYEKEKYTEDSKDYLKIEYNKNSYYVLKENIKEKIEDVVLEKKLYVRTSYNLMKDLEGKIGALAKKGDKVEVIGYNKLQDDGTVDIYKVKLGENEGYYYSKYLVQTIEEAKANYDPEGIYKTHKTRTNKLGGGSAANLDYFPVSKPNFEDNKMPSEVYALYINGSKGIKNSIDKYIEYAKTTKINAFVVDIKDNTVPAYKSKVYEEYSPTNYKYANNSIEDYQYAISKLKENGFYVIGRITTFKDDYYALDNKDNAIGTKSGGLLKHSGSYWPSPYKREVWEFTINLAKEAVNLFHFNEIQFDYVRFPDRLGSYESAGTIDYKNTYGEEKAEAIQKFLMYATNELHKMNVYVSADVFGESSWGYVTAYGQYWPAISNVVDAISAMPYTDHFDKNASSWTNPYQTLLNWGKTAATRQTETPSPAIARTWITAYDTPYWKPTTTYNGTMLERQIQGLYDAGLTGGYMTWNSGSSLAKYKTQFSAFNKEYKKS